MTLLEVQCKFLIKVFICCTFTLIKLALCWTPKVPISEFTICCTEHCILELVWKVELQRWFNANRIYLVILTFYCAADFVKGYTLSSRQKLSSNILYKIRLRCVWWLFSTLHISLPHARHHCLIQTWTHLMFYSPVLLTSTLILLFSTPVTQSPRSSFQVCLRSSWKIKIYILYWSISYIQGVCGAHRCWTLSSSSSPSSSHQLLFQNHCSPICSVIYSVNSVIVVTHCTVKSVSWKIKL